MIVMSVCLTSKLLIHVSPECQKNIGLSDKSVKLSKVHIDVIERVGLDQLTSREPEFLNQSTVYVEPAPVTHTVDG